MTNHLPLTGCGQGRAGVAPPHAGAGRAACRHAARAAQPRNDGLTPAGAIKRLPGGRGEGGRSERDRGVAMSVRAGVLRAAEGRAADG